MFKLFSKLRRPQLFTIMTKKGIRVKWHSTSPETIMQMLYVLIANMAKAQGVDFRYYVKQILAVDSKHKQILKATADPRPYKKKQAIKKGIIKK